MALRGRRRRVNRSIDGLAAPSYCILPVLRLLGAMGIGSYTGETPVPPIRQASSLQKLLHNGQGLDGANPCPLGVQLGDTLELVDLRGQQNVLFHAKGHQVLAAETLAQLLGQ